MHEGLDHASHIDLFVTKEYTGIITEYVYLPLHTLTQLKPHDALLLCRSEEMRPQWFSTGTDPRYTELEPIPYSQMWPDDVFWVPMLLAGQHFVGRADLDKDNIMQKWWFAEVK